jgi:ribosome recycling factor
MVYLPIYFLNKSLLNISSSRRHETSRFSMQPATEDYVNLKQEFADLIVKCREVIEEKEIHFQDYRKKIQTELAQLSKERELFDDRLSSIENVMICSFRILN